MTTPPVDPKPPADMEDPESAARPTGDDLGEPQDDRGGDDDSNGTDPMGIDDDDPIDSTLVGSPVDTDGDEEGTREG
jgi:hypothetical protein